MMGNFLIHLPAFFFYLKKGGGGHGNNIKLSEHSSEVFLLPDALAKLS